MSRQHSIRAWLVTFAGLGVNLILGVLYAWGVISAALIDQLGWSATQTQIPYMVACALFALCMVPGGRLQDHLGPRPVIMVSAVLAAIGFVFSGVFLTAAGLTFFFGVVFGAGMGIGYAAPTPAAVKWFHHGHRGLVAGIVVSGFGLAPVFIAPLTSHLLNRYGLQTTFYVFGAAFFVVIMLLAQLISNPPSDYIPTPARVAKGKPKPHDFSLVDYTWREVLCTRQFYFLWIMLCFGTFAGLLIIGQLSKIGMEQAGIGSPYFLVSLHAVFNFTGRIVFGIIADRIGKMRTLMVMFAMQVLNFLAFAHYTSPLPLMLGIAIVGLTFGGMLTVFPAATADYFGLKNFGLNYGMVITAWGFGGVFGPLLGGLARDFTGCYTRGYIVSAILSTLGCILTFFVRPPGGRSSPPRLSAPQGLQNS